METTGITGLLGFSIKDALLGRVGFRIFQHQNTRDVSTVGVRNGWRVTNMCRKYSCSS